MAARRGPEVEPRIVWREGPEGAEVMRLVVERVITPAAPARQEQRESTARPVQHAAPD